MKKTTIRILAVVPVLILFFVLFFNNQSLRSQLAVFRTQAEIEAQNKAWVWKWYEAKLNDEAEMIHNEMIAPDFVGHSSDSPDATHIVVMYEIAPMEVRDKPVVIRPIKPLIAAGDRVAFRYVVEVEDKGIEIKVEGIIIARFREGKLVESWILEDHLGMWHQLGMEFGPLETKK
jgi:predicted SnoaL-like aldol condensation-catalyzing enzyme